MTEHDRFLELAAISVDFELASEERHELDEHLAACPSCRSAAEEIAGQGAALASLPAVDAPERVQRAVVAATSSASSGGRRGAGLFAARFAMVAALAVAPLVLAVVVLRDLDLGIGFGSSGAGSGGESPGRIVWAPGEPGPDATSVPGASAAPTPPGSGAPASGAPPALGAELIAVTIADGRIVAVGHACDPVPQGLCRAAAVVVDAEGRAFDAPADPVLDVEVPADGSWAGMRDVVGGSGGFVAVGASARAGSPVAAVWRSEDGLLWDRLPDVPAFAEAWMNAVIVVDGSYVAVGGATADGGIRPAAWTSADGDEWVRAPDAPALAAGEGGELRAGRRMAGMWDVAWTGERYVAAGALCSSGTDCTATTWTSRDAVGWTLEPGEGVGLGTAAAVAATDQAAVVVGSGPSSALAWWVAADGTVSQQAFPPARAGELLAAASSGGLIAAGGTAGQDAGGVWLTSGDRWLFYGDDRLVDATILGIALDRDRIVAVGAIGGDPAAILIGRIEAGE